MKTIVQSIQDSVACPLMTRLQLECVREGLVGVMRPMRQLRRCMQAIPSAVSGGRLEAIFSTRLQVYLSEGRPLQEEGGNRMVPWAHSRITERIGTAEFFPQLVKTDGATQASLQETNASVPRNVNAKSKTAADVDQAGCETTQRKWEGLPRTDRLTQLLQEHERLQPQSRDVGQSAGESLAAHQRHSVKQETKRPAERSSNPTTWPQITGDQVATRLQAFVSGASVSANVPPVHEAFDASPKNPSVIQNSFHIQVNMRGENDHQWGSDLSEHIADVLREQAIQHGIDLT